MERPATEAPADDPKPCHSLGSSLDWARQGEENGRPPRWSMGILNDPKTFEVPGSILLVAGRRNEPLGMQRAPARNATSSTPSIGASAVRNSNQDKKMTKDGAIVLEPQPDDSHNDPLNWPVWRRDSALLSLGLYCMLGGGMTPILAAGFTNVAKTFGVSTARVSLTTGLYMMGLGVGAVVVSPTAILFGKRPIYLVGAMLLVLSAVWCALSPNFVSLLVARIFQGIAVSPVECSPSATIAEIYFLHERAYRIGIYTFLLLSGKNLIPLVSAVIIQSLGWRWVFWIVAMTGGFYCCLLFLVVPETFWDRTRKPKSQGRSHHAPRTPLFNYIDSHVPRSRFQGLSSYPRDGMVPSPITGQQDEIEPATPAYTGDVFYKAPTLFEKDVGNTRLESDWQKVKKSEGLSTQGPEPESYTAYLRQAARQTFTQQLRPYNGRLQHGTWLRVAIRPFILYSYPAVLWSSVVYSCSIGWLIVLSESVAVVYRSRTTYNFSVLSAGLIYLSPFIGGILGTVVAGKMSDIIVRAMSRRNGGLYEPEFRLVMAVPITITTVIGLMGFGWSAQIHDSWIVPTIFFGIISFGCSLGSTTAITFCVDSYRQYANEALVTLNLSKNILHGLVFSLFFTSWLESDGFKMTFIWLGIIQLIFMFFSVHMYIFGKRARMWTVQVNLMEKF